jgi:hypothetical protein
MSRKGSGIPDMPRLGPIERIPDSRKVTLPVTARPPDWRVPDTAKLQRELSKKCPVLRIRMVGKNPPDANGSIHLFMVVYLAKEVFGPTLRQMVKDVYAYAKKQVADANARKLALPPAFIHNGASGKKPRAAPRKRIRKSRRPPDKA